VQAISFSRYNNLTVEEATVPFASTTLPIDIDAYGKVLNVGDACNFAYSYLPVSPVFLALSPAAEITVGTPRFNFSGTSTNWSSVYVRLVVASVGNYIPGQLDPTTETRTVTFGDQNGCAGAPITRTYNVGANIVAGTTETPVGSQSTTSQVDLATFTNTRVNLMPGWKYQVFVQLFGACAISVKVTWTGGQINLVL
jgi:hypothetical protein